MIFRSISKLEGILKFGKKIELVSELNINFQKKSEIFWGYQFRSDPSDYTRRKENFNSTQPDKIKKMSIPPNLRKGGIFNYSLHLLSKIRIQTEWEVPRHFPI